MFSRARLCYQGVKEKQFTTKATKVQKTHKGVAPCVSFVLLWLLW